MFLLIFLCAAPRIKQINFLVDISLRQSIYDIYDRQMARANQCVVDLIPLPCKAFPQKPGSSFWFWEMTNFRYALFGKTMGHSLHGLIVIYHDMVNGKRVVLKKIKRALRQLPNKWKKVYGQFYDRHSPRPRISQLFIE